LDNLIALDDGGKDEVTTVLYGYICYLFITILQKITANAVVGHAKHCQVFAIGTGAHKYLLETSVLCHDYERVPVVGILLEIVPHGAIVIADGCTSVGEVILGAGGGEP
jgi:hypothetical protein